MKTEINENKWLLKQLENLSTEDRKIIEAMSVEGMRVEVDSFFQNMQKNVSAAIVSDVYIENNPKLREKVERIHPNIVNAQNKVAENLKIQAALLELKQQTYEMSRTEKKERKVSQLN